MKTNSLMKAPLKVCVGLVDTLLMGTKHVGIVIIVGTDGP